MTTIAQDAATRADIKEDRKLETETKPVEATPAPTTAPNALAKAKKEQKPKQEAAKPAQAKKEPAKPKAEPKAAPIPAEAKPKAEPKAAPIPAEAKPKAEPKAAPIPAEAKPKGPFTKKPEAKPVAEPFKLPKPLAGAAPIYLLFAAKRQDNVADNRRNESLNNMQEQLFLGVSVDKTILETAKANYTKEFPHLYFWISTKKVLGEMPKDLGLALQIENVLIARGKM